MECHDRYVRFHILVMHLVMHLERDRPGFSYDMEDQQLMNCVLARLISRNELMVFFLPYQLCKV
jgi:hypothetical protein